MDIKLLPQRRESVPAALGLSFCSVVGRMVSTSQGVGVTPYTVYMYVGMCKGIVFDILDQRKLIFP